MDAHDDADEGMRSFVDVLCADGSAERPDPPVPGAGQLPSDQLSPPMFERLVAEFALRVDGLSQIKIYGRTGQSQAGLDLIGWCSKGITVYQVRRVKRLSASALRKAVTDFAKPLAGRRFEAAKRFVLVTGCAVDDRNVYDELANLKSEYEGDLEIDLYDNTDLSIKLRYQGPLVYGIFGPKWAETFCGYGPPSSVPASAPPERAYLADPVDILGFSELHARAHGIAVSEPEAAAEIFGELARELETRGFVPRALQLRESQLKSYRNCGRTDHALSVALELALAEYESGDLSPGGSRITEIIELAGSEIESLGPVLQAIAAWFESGYDLSPVVENLTRILEAGAPYSTTLLLIVAEQVLADDDPRDDHVALLDLIEQWVATTSGLERTRLTCCAADFRTWSGTTPTDAFHELTRLASTGYVGADEAALIYRRCGRASASTDPDLAVDHYRRAVLSASGQGLGGDLRDALRSLAFLANVGDRHQPMEAARSVADRRRLLDGIDLIVASALESLADGRLPQALRSTHDWVRRERVNGALLDEIVALRRYGTVYDRAGEHAIATRSLVRAGARKEVKESAFSAGSNYVDVTRYLEPRQLIVVQEAAAACIVSQAAYVPDRQVVELCGRLCELAEGIGTEQILTTQAPTEALRALAAFGARFPEDIGASVLDKVEPLIEREKGRSRLCDSALLDLLATCARHPSTDLAERGVVGLVRCVKEQVLQADDYLRSIGSSQKAIDLLLPLAAEDNGAAIELLAAWDVVTPGMRESALYLARRVLERPVGHQRSSWTVGEGVQKMAIRFAAALRSDPYDTELVDVRDLLVEHLLCWAEDENDVAENRSDVIHAIRILSCEIPAQTRASAVDRVLALHDEPRFNLLDELQQESLHPLSRFRFSSASAWFPEDCLFVAAVLAQTLDQRDAVWSRVENGILDAEISKEAANSLGRAALCLNQLQAIDIRNLASHPQPLLREAAVVCWVHDHERDPTYAARFATDQHWAVRANLAKEVLKLEPHVPVYDSMAQQLRLDTNQRVRELVDDD